MNPSTFEFEAIGTHWKIDIFDDVTEEKKSDVRTHIDERIKIFDKNYSRFREDSLVAEMSRKAGTYLLPEDAENMFGLYQKMYQVTDGHVTPLIGQVLVDAGYDATYSLTQKSMAVPKSWEEVIIYDFPSLTLNEPALLDFGAGGKGYLIDIVGEILASHGFTSYCVDAGGDMLYRNPNNTHFRVGLEHPEHIDQVIGVVSLGNESLCGSAGNRRTWGDFHHIIDPNTLKSPRHILAIWTVAENTLLADLLTTALFFTPVEKLLKYFQFEYLILNSDYTFDKSLGFNAEVFAL